MITFSRSQYLSGGVQMSCEFRGQRSIKFALVEKPLRELFKRFISMKFPRDQKRHMISVCTSQYFISRRSVAKCNSIQCSFIEK